ncbi:hypothetical protein EV426DRAFT_640691 [Tirmania nivea]|nr:hypothetical protein EV426DRAFT_640691 [Tirmania nivea]
MRLLLAKRLTATALRKHVLSSVPTIRTGIALGQGLAQHTTRITRGSLHESSRRFFSDDAKTVDPSWVRRVTEVPTSTPEPQVEKEELAMAEEESVQEAAPAVTKKKTYRRKDKKSIDTSAPFTPLAGAEVDTAGFTGNWPTTPEKLDAARDFIEDAAASPHAVLIMPDRDTDGLAAGTIVSLTLQLLGKPVDQIHVHFVQRGRYEKMDIERTCQKHKIGYIIILDQGSRKNAEALIVPSPSPASNAPERKTLIIDHQYGTSFAPNTTVLTSHGHRPIASTSLLAYTLCCTLHPTAPDAAALPALVGTFGDFSSSTMALDMLRSPPVSLYLNTAPAMKKYTSKWINKLITLLNVARRTPLTECSEAIRAAWDIFQFDPNADPAEWPTPKQIMSGTWGSQQLRDAVTRLTKLQERSNAEMDRLKRVPPKFSSDGKIAVIEIASPWQIHPLLASRWVGLLGTRNMREARWPRLLALAVANREYMQGKVSFSVRSTAYAAERDVDLIALLKEYADKLPSGAREKMGEGFVRGNKGSPGGALEAELWERYRTEGMRILDLGRGGGGGVVLGNGGEVFGAISGISGRKVAVERATEDTIPGSRTGAASDAGATGVVE